MRPNESSVGTFQRKPMSAVAIATLTACRGVLSVAWFISTILLPVPLRADAPPPATLPTLLALCVGAGTFNDRHLRPISQAADDARTVGAALLAQRGRGLYGDVEVHIVTGKEATRARVLQEIEYLRNHAHLGDVTVVYLCGYETADDDARARFLTADIVFDNIENTSPLLSDMHRLLLDLPAGHALVLLDLNHGDPLGSMTGGLAARGAARKHGMRPRLYDPGLTTSDLPKTVRLLYSATGREPGVDSAPGHSPTIGVFAETVVEALNGHAAGSGGSNASAITAGDLCRFVQARVPQIADDTQHPYVPFASDPFEDFPLAAAAR